MTVEEIRKDLEPMPLLHVEDSVKKKKRGRPAKVKKAAEVASQDTSTPKIESTSPSLADKKVIISNKDDDDELETSEQVFVPRGLPPRLLSTTPQTPAMLRQQVITQQQKINDDFESYLSALEFDDGQHFVTVHRVEPEYDPVTNKRIVGYLEKFTRAVTFEEIRSKYGGGKYRFIVHGPGPMGKNTIKGNKVYEIAGDPIAPVTARQQTQAPQPLIPEAVSDIVDKALSSQEKQADRLAEENRELQREMKQIMLSTLNKGDGGLKEAMMQMLTEERKLHEARAAQERKLQEDRINVEKQEAKETRNMLLSTLNKSEMPNLQSVLMEERRLQEQRLAAEREERRREQEAAERRHQQTLEMLRMQNEKQIEQMRLEQERVRAEAREASERARQQFELQLKQIEKQENQKAADALKMTEFMAGLQAQQVQQMQTAQQMQLQQMQQFTQLERDFMSKQIDALSKKDTGIDQMLKFKQLFDTLTGADRDTGESKETWEKILDRINDSVPGIVAAAGLLRGAGGQNAQASAQQQPKVAPGSVAVVDDEDFEPVPIVDMRARRLSRKRRLTRPVGTNEKVVQAKQTNLTNQNKSTESSASDAVITGLPNDYTDFVFPTEDTSMEGSLEMLVKDIDLALQKDMAPSEIVEKIVKKFPPTVEALITNTEVDTLTSVLEMRAPSTWRINSLDGQQKVKELHFLLVSNR